MSKVSIIMGSKSDLPVAEKAINILKKFEVPFDINVASAHRTPHRVEELVINSDADVFIAIAGFIYMFEVISVMLQVSYYRISGGKRIFRMAPIHHHFEKGGWSETKVVNVFTTATILLCLLAYIGL